MFVVSLNMKTCCGINPMQQQYITLGDSPWLYALGRILRLKRPKPKNKEAKTSRRNLYKRVRPRSNQTTVHEGTSSSENEIVKNSQAS
jgi:hypothetical protein